MKSCEWCGQSFEVIPRKRTRFCGKSCAQRWQWKHNPRRREGVCAGNKKSRFAARFNCERCGNKFLLTRRNRLYCSVKCGTAAVKKRRNQKLSVKRKTADRSRRAYHRLTAEQKAAQSKRIAAMRRAQRALARAERERKREEKRVKLAVMFGQHS